jgi:hypothetical protein
MLGPLSNCVFDARLGGYFGTSPNQQDSACLSVFFGLIVGGSAAVPCRYKQIGNNYIVSTCNHLILIKAKRVFGFVIANIKPVGGQWYLP